MVGLGFGSTVQVPVLQSLKDFEVVALVGSNAQKAHSIANHFGVPHDFHDYRSIEELGLDAVSVALPPYLSSTVIKWAISKGFHVLAEKPLSCSVIEIREIISLISLLKQESSKPLFVGMCDFQFLELTAFDQFKTEVNKRSNERLKFARIVWAVQSHAEKHGLLNWKRSQSNGGGVLNLLGGHLFYYVEHIFGRISKIFATTHTAAIAKEDPDFDYAENTVSLNLWLISGVQVNVFVTNNSTCQMVHDIDVNYRDSRVRLINTTSDYMSGFELQVFEGEKHRIFHFPEKDGRSDAFGKLAQRFSDSIRVAKKLKGTTDTFRVWPSFEDGQRVQMLVDWSNESIISGKIIAVN